MSTLANLAVIENCPVGCRILEKNAEHVLANTGGCDIRYPDVNSARTGSRADDVDRLRMTERGHEKYFLALTPLHGIAHCHRFGGRSRFVQKRCVGDAQ